MTEIISTILEAERLSEEKIALSADRAREIRAAADAKAEAIKAEAKVKAADYKKAALFAADKKADEVYAAKIAKSEKEAEEMKARAREKLLDAADFILKGLIK